jgi:hypothetical protein
MHSIAIVARNRVGFDNLAPLRRRVQRSRRATRDSRRKTGKRSASPRGCASCERGMQPF